LKKQTSIKLFTYFSVANFWQTIRLDTLTIIQSWVGDALPRRVVRGVLEIVDCYSVQVVNAVER